jgi:hypothetical protein
MKSPWQHAILAFVALLVALSMANGFTRALTPHNETPNQSAQEDALASDTFKLLLLADQSGANVTDQVNQFNTALQLISDGNSLINSGEDQQGRLKLTQADQIFENISHDAATLRSEADARNKQHVLETYGLAIGFIAVTTILAFLTLRLYDKYARKRTLDFEFEVKGR